MSDQILTVIVAAGANVAARLAVAQKARMNGDVSTKSFPQILYFASYHDSWELCHHLQLRKLGFRLGYSESHGLDTLRIHNPEIAMRLSRRRDYAANTIGKLVSEIAFSHEWSKWYRGRHDTIIFRSVSGASYSDAEWRTAIIKANQTMTRP